jgi:hypothetical protein
MIEPRRNDGAHRRRRNSRHAAQTVERTAADASWVPAPLVHRAREAGQSPVVLDAHAWLPGMSTGRVGSVG